MTPDARAKHFHSLLTDAAFANFLDANGLYLEQRKAEKTLPRPIEMEQCALGAMLMLNEEPLTRGMAKLHGAHLSMVKHRVIFGAIIRAEHKRRSGQEPDLKRIDIVVVAEELRQMNKLDEIGGAAYLVALIDACPSSENIDFYIGKVILAARRRYLFALGENLETAALDLQADPAQLTNAVRAALDAIDNTGRADLKRIFEATK